MAHKICKNCYSPLKEEDVFCPDCGQQYRASIPSLWELLKTAFESVFNLDGRLWRTVYNLLSPGRLTEFYLAGRQKAYIHPFRLLLISGAIFITAFSFIIKQQIGQYIDSSVQKKTATAYEKKFTEQLQEQITQLQAIYPDTAVKIATDSLLAMHQSQEADTVWIGYLHYAGGLSFEQRELDIDVAEYHLLPPSEIVQKYGVEGAFNQYLVKQIIHVNRSGSRGITQIIGQLIWGILLLIPLSAALLQLVYIRHKRKYVEHLVFSMHTHSFMFLAAALSILFTVAKIEEDGDMDISLAGNALFILPPVYFLFAQSRVYLQSRWKLWLRSGLLFFLYLLLLVLVLASALVLGILLL